VAGNQRSWSCQDKHMRDKQTLWAAAGALLCASLAAGVGTAATSDVRLVEAAKAQDDPTVRALLAQHIDVNSRSEDGSTALLWAAHWSDLTAAETLLRAGADANAANAFKITPLSLACTNGNGALVERLLKAGARANAAIATGETPLMTCAGSGDADAVRTLIAHGAEVNLKEPSEHQTALMWAAAERHPEVVQLLLSAGADPALHSKKGFTALHFAAREGDVESARLLLAGGVDVNIRSIAESPDKSSASDEGSKTGRTGSGNAATKSAGPAGPAYQASLSAGSTPLLVATVRGQVPLALFLLEHGADPNVGDAGFMPLHWAAGTWENGVSNPVYGFSDPMSGIPSRSAKLQLVHALLAHGADPNARMTHRPPTFTGGYEDAAGATPFLIASAAADVEMMRILLGAGADPMRATDSKATPVMAASGLNHGIGESTITEAQALETVRFLMSLGADASGATTSNENALFGAAYRGWNTLLELLVEKGANVNAVSKAGVTPWLAASGYGDRLGGVLYNKEGADLLLKHGADPKLGKPCQAQIKCR
jgi:ankyrin repeat protein